MLFILLLLHLIKGQIELQNELFTGTLSERFFPPGTFQNLTWD